jgi:hypothetical protein
MTEVEWLDCTDPQPMMELLKGKASDRKLRLFAVACCRRIWNLLTHEQSRRVVEFAERYADGNASVDQMQEAGNGSYDAYHRCRSEVNRTAEAAGVCGGFNEGIATAAAAVNGIVDTEDAFRSTRYLADNTSEAVGFVAEEQEVKQEESQHQAGLLRDIFGNPFHHITIDPSWQTPTVKALTQTIYTDRAFDQMPSLAEALEKAGCDNPEILGHCRGPGPHVRGCWALDLVLGKE